jgi:hypothetical protein
VMVLPTSSIDKSEPDLTRPSKRSEKESQAVILEVRVGEVVDKR